MSMPLKKTPYPLKGAYNHYTMLWLKLGFSSWAKFTVPWNHTFHNKEFWIGHPLTNLKIKGQTRPELQNCILEDVCFPIRSAFKRNILTTGFKLLYKPTRKVGACELCFHDSLAVLLHSTNKPHQNKTRSQGGRAARCIPRQTAQGDFLLAEQVYVQQFDLFFIDPILNQVITIEAYY